MELYELLDNFSMNYSYEYSPESLPEPCPSDYCSDLSSSIPAFLAAVSGLGLLSNGACGIALVLFPRFWKHHHSPGKTTLLLTMVATTTSAAILPFFVVGLNWGWRFGGGFCQVAHGLRFGCLFAQGLVVLVGTPGLPWCFPKWFLPTVLWVTGFLLATPAALLHDTDGDEWVVCTRSQKAELLSWAHAALCLAVFVTLPVALATMKVAPSWCGCNWRPHMDITWLFFLLWAPYGIGLFLDSLLRDQIFIPSCSFLERLDYFLGLSEGLGLLHCFLCPLSVLARAIYCQQTGAQVSQH